MSRVCRIVSLGLAASFLLTGPVSVIAQDKKPKPTTSGPSATPRPTPLSVAILDFAATGN